MRLQFIDLDRVTGRAHYCPMCRSPGTLYVHPHGGGWYCTEHWCPRNADALRGTYRQSIYGVQSVRWVYPRRLSECV